MFKKAILIIHGFAGSPYDEESLARFLELDKNYDVFTFTLPGHENCVFMNNKYEDWIEASISQIDFLISNGYKKIYVIGHSMGGVIATFLATKYKEIKKLVLAAPAFKYFYSKDDNLKIKISKSKKIISDYGYEAVLKRVLKTSVKSTKEFMNLVNKYYETPKEITIPTLIIQGLEDSIVEDGSEYVYNLLTDKKVLLYVSGVNHDIFNNKKVDLINSEIKEFLKCKNVVSGIKNI